MANMYRADQEQKVMGEVLSIFPYVQHVQIRPKTKIAYAAKVLVDT